MLEQISDLQAQFEMVIEQLSKASLEITTQIQAMRDELANHPHTGTLSEGAETALTALTAVAQTLDDVVDDVPPVLISPRPVRPRFRDVYK